MSWADDHLIVVAKRRAKTVKERGYERERKLLVSFYGWSVADADRIIKIERKENGEALDKHGRMEVKRS